MRKFTCDICRQKLPIGELADDVIKRGGGSARLALQRLPEHELICQTCLDTFDALQDEDWGDPDVDGAYLQFYLDLVDSDRIDRCTFDWLRQNY